MFEPLRMAGTSLAGSPASGATSTVVDLARFANELLAPTLIAAATLAEATAPAFPGLAGVVPGIGRFDPCDWGLGFELKGAKVPHWTPPRASPGTFGHFGASGTFLWVDPIADLARRVPDGPPVRAVGARPVAVARTVSARPLAVNPVGLSYPIHPLELGRSTHGATKVPGRQSK